MLSEARLLIKKVLESSDRPLTPKEIAEKTGLPAQTVRTYVRQMEQIREIKRIAHGKYIAVEQKRKHVIKDVSEGEMALVPLVTVRASAGHGEKPYEEEVEKYLCMDPVSLRREAGVSPSRVIAMIVSGDSMEPTIRPGEVALIALHNDEPLIDGAVYVLRVGEVIMLKRLHYRQDYILLRSDNPVYPEQRLDKLADVRIIGRVFRIIRAM